MDGTEDVTTGFIVLVIALLLAAVVVVVVDPVVHFVLKLVDVDEHVGVVADDRLMTILGLSL